MKNIINKISLVALVLFGAISCDDGFEELNQDPNEPTSVPAVTLLTDQQRTIPNNMYSTFIGVDMGGCWAQHWGKVQYNDEERYIPRRTSIDDIWDQFYSNVIDDASSMYTLAGNEKNDVLQGVALVMQAYAYGVITDLYGSIPFTEANKNSEGNFTPVYDKQDVVYQGIFKMLDEAIVKLQGEGDITASNDIMYQGDAAKWLKFARALKFRSLMRVSNKTSVGGQLNALLNAGMMTSNNDNASVKYLDAAPNANPIYESVVFGNRGEFKLNEKLVLTLQNFNDPRLAVYAQPNTDGVYRGKPAGVKNLPNNDWNYDNVSSFGTKYLSPSLPGVLMSYAEQQFLIAEAISRGFIGGNAEMYYLSGIQASMEENGVGSGYNSYISQPTIAFTSNKTNDLSRILTQKWIALYGQGIEAWTEWRRSISSTFPKGMPELNAALEGALNQVPYRYTYPYLEQSLNGTNYNAAVAAQGKDVLTTKVWWMN